MEVRFSSLPKIKTTNPQYIRTLSREELQTLMDFLKQEHVPYYLLHDKTKPAPAVSVKLISSYTNISVRTLRNYIQKLSINPDYNPYDTYHSMNRAMSDKLEEQLITQIDEMYIKPGYYFNNRTLKHLALALWTRANEEDRLKETFNASDSWCRHFRIRHGYVWRRARAARRPEKTEEFIHRCEQYLNNILEIKNKLLEMKKLQFLVNADETSWKLAYEGDLTWARKGAKSVKVNINYNKKQCLTAIATILAASDGPDYGKLPLYLIAKGKTNRCHQQIENIADYTYEIDHSPSGWTTVPVMFNYLNWLRNYMNEKYHASKETIYLILDIYRAHTDARVKTLAENLNIKLLFIPAGATDIYQPLDRNVFGALKGKARGYWYTKYVKNPQKKLNLRHAAKTLLRCWAELGSRSIEEGWLIYQKLIAEEFNDDCVEDIYEDSINDTYSKITKQFRNICANNNENFVEDRHSEEEEENDAKQEEESDSELDDFESSDDSYGEIESYRNQSYNIDVQRPNDEATHFFDDTNQISPSLLRFTSIDYNEAFNPILAFECERNSNRKTIAKIQKKRLDFPEVVGIENYQNTCAFNTFIQLLSVIPEANSFITHPVDPLEISVSNAISIIFNAYTCSIQSIDPFNTFLNFYSSIRKSQKEAEQWSHQLIETINNPDHSVITLILDMIPRELFDFHQYIKGGKVRKTFLWFQKRTFQNELSNIDVTSLNSMLWCVRDDGYEPTVDPFTFPFQIELKENSNETNTKVVLVLQAIAINIDQIHFEVFIRKSILSSQFIEVNDSLVQQNDLSHTTKKYPSIALYRVFH